MITTRVFGKTSDGKTVLEFTLADGRSSVSILNYGGVIRRILVPANDGRLTDVVLGYNTVKEYEENGGYLGALIGRFGNRIGGGKLTVDETEYALYCNDRGNHLHGGKQGFNKKIWSHGIVGNTLALSVVSPDGDENYPGRLMATVVYTFRNGKLRIHYRAVSDKKTAVNLTNHAYFNLGGDSAGTILDHELTIDADCITPTDEAMIPTGDFRAVEGTPFDFRTPKKIGQDIGADDEDLKKGNGYDHCFVLNGTGMKQYAEVYCARTGIGMTCRTDMPAVQLYTGNGLKQQGKYSKYTPRTGFCLETEAIPNNVNVPAYAEKGSSILDAGEIYDFCAEYEFWIR